MTSEYLLGQKLDRSFQAAVTVEIVVLAAFDAQLKKSKIRIQNGRQPISGLPEIGIIK
ncbi:MAG: hypothetical protein K2P86_11730 [Xanthobacteraceae bacterium]|nr:hypothetical protein [Xanthobacteraceae bacterium]